MYKKFFILPNFFQSFFEFSFFCFKYFYLIIVLQKYGKVFNLPNFFQSFFIFNFIVVFELLLLNCSTKIQISFCFTKYFLLFLFYLTLLLDKHYFLIALQRYKKFFNLPNIFQCFFKLFF